VPVLTDPDVAPDERRISAALGGAMGAWRALESALAEPSFDLSLSWRHYRDGGWLCKALRRRRNLAWLAVWDRYFTATFYFAARQRSDLVALPIGADLQRQAAEAEMTGLMLPLVIEVHDVPDVEAVLEVMRYKLTAK
jgi:hypothetical protein